MATVTNFANAFETTLAADMLGTDLTAQVQTTDGAPSSPCYLVIDPHNADKREYVLFDGTFGATSFVTTALANRYLDGSAAASGITHAAGAIVRFSPVAQHFQNIQNSAVWLDEAQTISGVKTFSVDPTLADGSSALSQTEGDAAYSQVIGGAGQTTDVELQAAITAAADGDLLILAQGSTWSLNAQVAWSDKTLHIDATGATVVEATALTVPVIKATNAHDSTVTGLTIQGAESLASWPGTDVASDRVGIEFATSDRVRVVNLTVTGKSYGVRLVGCTRSRLVEPTITGFADATMAYPNHHSGVVVSGGSRNTVISPDGQALGSVVLGIMGTLRLQTFLGHGENLWDNGVYISSGERCSVLGFEAASIGSGGGEWSGVKVRGKHHTVASCTVRNAGIGIAVSGNGTTTDALGANGGFHVIEGNILVDLARDGVRITEQDGFYPRQIRVEGNVIQNSVTGGGGYAAIRGTGHDIAVVNNTIDGCANTTGAILLAGLAGNTHVDIISGVDVSGNKLYNCSDDGIRLGRVTESKVARNIGRTVTGDLIDLRTVTKTDIEHNRKDVGFVVRGNVDTTNNRYIKNHADNGATRSLLVDAADASYLDNADSGPPSADAAVTGSVWWRNDGGAGTSMYVKEAAGSAGWVAK